MRSAYYRALTLTAVRAFVFEMCNFIIEPSKKQPWVEFQDYLKKIRICSNITIPLAATRVLVEDLKGD